MLPKILADLALFTHFAFIVFVLFGALLVLYRRWVAWIHIPMVAWASVVNLMGWVCPLTPIENYFRIAAGEAGYAGGFVEHYIAPLVYPGRLASELALTIGVSVIAWNVLLYAVSVYWLKRKP